jgi:hypothetical protein
MIEGIGAPNPGQLAQFRESSGANAEEAAAGSAKAKQSETASALKAPDSSEAHREEDSSIKREKEHPAPAVSAGTLDESVGRNVDIRV